jgi:hypothetical protein
MAATVFWNPSIVNSSIDPKNGNADVASWPCRMRFVRHSLTLWCNASCVRFHLISLGFPPFQLTDPGTPSQY